MPCLKTCRVFRHRLFWFVVVVVVLCVVVVVVVVVSIDQAENKQTKKNKKTKKNTKLQRPKAEQQQRFSVLCNCVFALCVNVLFVRSREAKPAPRHQHSLALALPLLLLWMVGENLSPNDAAEEKPKKSKKHNSTKNKTTARLSKFCGRYCETSDDAREMELLL